MDSKNLAEQTERLKNDEGDGTTAKEENKSIWSKITLEPMWFGVTASLTMGIFAFKNLYIQRACLVDLGYSEDVCLHSTGDAKKEIEVKAQMIVSSLMVGSGFIGGFITSALLVFLGPWSDTSGRRKPLIILPILGMIMTSVGLLILQAFPKVATVWVVYTAVLPLAIGGNFSLLIMASFSHLGDICYKTGRCPTTMMGSNSGFISIFMVIGSLIGPLLYRKLGLVGVFGISFFFELTSLAYAIWKVEDVYIAKKIPSLLDWTLPLQAIKCVFKKREGNRRKIIFLMIIVPCCNSMLFQSELSLTYMYLRKRFSWTEVEYGALSAFKSIIQAVGTLTIVALLKRRLKMQDKTIGWIGGISQMIASIGFMISFNNLTIFGLSILGIAARGAMIAERPVLNKQIQANEQGKINCVTAVLEKFVSFLVVPLANYIYSKTLTTLPQTYLFIGIVTGIVQAICFFCVKDEPKKEEEMKANVSNGV